MNDYEIQVWFTVRANSVEEAKDLLEKKIKVGGLEGNLEAIDDPQ